MKTIETGIRENLSKTISDGGRRVEEAVAQGPAETLKALEALIATLNAQAVAVALIVALAGGCGDPNCPNCGQASRKPEP